jgi:hypothetical protein
MAIDPFTQAHDAVVDAMRQVDAAWRLRQENPALIRQALTGFHEASAAYARAVEQQEKEPRERGALG